MAFVRLIYMIYESDDTSQQQQTRSIFWREIQFRLSFTYSVRCI